MLRRAAALLLLVGACSGPSTATAEPVAVPDHLRPVAATVDGDARLTLLAGAGGCFRLVVEVGGRRQVDPADRCGTDQRSVVLTEAPEVVFNDRERTFPVCDDRGDCAGRPADASLGGAVLLGRLRAPAALGCVPEGGGGLVPLRPDGDGYLLQPTTVSRYDVGEPLLFLADGRTVAPDPSRIAPGAVDACRALLSLPSPDVPTSAWSLEVRIPRSTPGAPEAVAVLTDTGFDAEGASLEAIAGGHRFRLLLHPDTEALLVSYLEGDPTGRRVPLPAEVVASLRAGTPCGDRLLLDAEGELTSDCP